MIVIITIEKKYVQITEIIIVGYYGTIKRVKISFFFFRNRSCLSGFDSKLKKLKISYIISNQGLKLCDCLFWLI